MGVFRAYAFKLIRNPLFYIGIIGTALLCASRLLPQDHGMMGSHVAIEIDMVLDLSTTRKMIAILGALPFAANFADEWTNHVTLGCVSRCGVKKYTVSNVVMCVISSTITVFLGMMLYAWVLSFFKPVFVDSGNPMGGLKDILLRGGAPWVYIMYRIFLFAASCAMWSVMGMMLTAFFPNKYVGLCSPFVASYIIERLSMELPDEFNLYVISMGYLNWKNIYGLFFYCVGLCASLTIICGFVFGIMVKRRVQNEMA